MKNTTLCYLEKNGETLLLHRIKKEQDENAGKWVGIGGHFEEGESPEDCVLREFQEETGLKLCSFRYRGLVTFVSDEWGTEWMHLFSATEADGELLEECNEGELAWVPTEEILGLPIWEGDRIFLKLLRNSSDFFSLKLCYQGDQLVKAVLNGQNDLLL